MDDFSHLQKAFESVEKFKNLTPQQRLDVSNQMYEGLKKQEGVTPAFLRDFRKDQERMLYESAKAKGTNLSFEGWKQEYLGRTPGSRDLGFWEPKDEENAAIQKFLRKNESEYARDYLSFPIRNIGKLPATLADFAHSLVGMGAAAGEAAFRSISSLGYDRNGSFVMKENPIQVFGEAMERWKTEDKTGLHLTQVLQGMREEDPEMASIWEWTAGSLMFSAPRGLAQAYNAGKNFFMPSASTRFKAFAAPVTAQSLTDLATYQGIKSLENYIYESDLEEGTKTGLSTMLMLGLGHLFGIGAGALTERAIMGDLQARDIANRLSNAIASAEYDKARGTYANAPVEFQIGRGYDPTSILGEQVEEPYFARSTQSVLQAKKWQEAQARGEITLMARLREEAEKKKAEYKSPYEELRERLREKKEEAQEEDKVQDFGSIRGNLLDQIRAHPEIEQDLKDIITQIAQEEGVTPPIGNFTIAEEAATLDNAVRAKNKTLSTVPLTPAEVVELAKQVKKNDGARAAKPFSDEEVLSLLSDDPKVARIRVRNRSLFALPEGLQAGEVVPSSAIPMRDLSSEEVIPGGNENSSRVIEAEGPRAITQSSEALSRRQEIENLLRRPREVEPEETSPLALPYQGRLGLPDRATGGDIVPSTAIRMGSEGLMRDIPSGGTVRMGQTSSGPVIEAEGPRALTSTSEAIAHRRRVESLIRRGTASISPIVSAAESQPITFTKRAIATLALPESSLPPAIKQSLEIQVAETVMKPGELKEEPVAPKTEIYTPFEEYSYKQGYNSYQELEGLADNFLDSLKDVEFEKLVDHLEDIKSLLYIQASDEFKGSIRESDIKAYSSIFSAIDRKLPKGTVERFYKYSIADIPSKAERNILNVAYRNFKKSKEKLADNKVTEEGASPPKLSLLESISEEGRMKEYAIRMANTLSEEDGHGKITEEMFDNAINRIEEILNNWLKEVDITKKTYTIASEFNKYIKKLTENKGAYSYIVSEIFRNLGNSITKHIENYVGEKRQKTEKIAAKSPKELQELYDKWKLSKIEDDAIEESTLKSIKQAARAEAADVRYRSTKSLENGRYYIANRDKEIDPELDKRIKRLFEGRRYRPLPKNISDYINDPNTRVAELEGSIQGLARKRERLTDKKEVEKTDRTIAYLEEQLKEAREAADIYNERVAKFNEAVRRSQAEREVEEKPTSTESSEESTDLKDIPIEVERMRNALRSMRRRLPTLSDSPEARAAIEESIRKLEWKIRYTGYLPDPTFPTDADRKFFGERLEKAKKEKVAEPIKPDPEAKPEAEEWEPWTFRLIEEKDFSTYTIQEKLARLSDADQMRIAQIAEIVNNGRVAMKGGKPLTAEDKLDTLQKIYEKKSLWNGSIYLPSDSVLMTDGSISAGFVEARYPGLASALSVLNPEAKTTQSFSLDSLLGMIQGGVLKSGRGTLDAEFSKNRPGLMQAFKLLDDIKEVLPKVNGGQTFRQFLVDNAKNLGLTQKGASSIAAAFKEAFPDFQLAFQNGVTQGRAIATADALTRMITIGGDVKSLREVMHEVGHMYFYYGLDADAKMQWLDQMRRLTKDDALWASAFPGWTERMQRFNDVKAEAIARRNDLREQQQQAIARNLAKDELYLNSPAEMFAQQFSAFMFENQLPTAQSLTAFTKIKDKILSMVIGSEASWNTLPQPTKEFFIKMQAMPGENDIVRVPNERIKEELSKNWMAASSPAEALARVQELNDYFNTTYGMREIETPQMREEMAVDGQTSVVQTGEVPFMELPVEQRMASYRIEDLPKVMERNILLLQADDPAFSLDEYGMAKKKLSTLLNPKGRDAFLMQQTLQRYKAVEDTTMVQSSLGVESGEMMDIQTGQLSSQAQAQEANTLAREIELGRMSELDQQYVMQSESQAFRVKKSFVERALDEAIKKNNLKLTPQERERWVNDILSAPSVEYFPSWDRTSGIKKQIYIELDDQLPNKAERGAWGQATIAANQVLESTLTSFHEARKFAYLTMADKGMIDIIDDGFANKMYHADQFSKIGSYFPSNKDAKWWLNQSWAQAVRGAFFAYMGLEEDPEGNGIVWNPERYLQMPAIFAIMPGSGMLAKGLKIGGRTIGRKAYGYLPQEFKDKYDKMANQVRSSVNYWLRKGGTDNQEAKDALSMAYMQGRARANSIRAFAELFQYNYTPKQLRAISNMIDRNMSRKILRGGNFTKDEKASIEMGAFMVENIINKVGQELVDLGIVPNKVMLPHYFANALNQNLLNVFNLESIQPIRLKGLRGNELVFRSKDTKATRSLIGSMVPEGGIQIGQKVNEWLDQWGKPIFSVVGSKADALYRAGNAKGTYKRGHVWTDTTKGLTIDDITKNGKEVIFSRPFTAEELKIKGDVSEVSVRLAYMAASLERDYIKGNLFKTIFNSNMAISPNKRMSGKEQLPGGIKTPDYQLALHHLKDSNDGSWIEIPDEQDPKSGFNKYGLLSGAWIHRDAYDVIKSVTSPTRFDIARLKGPGYSEALSLYTKLLTAWKKSKTVWYFPSHMNNFVSNIVMGSLLGHNIAAELTEGYHLAVLSQMERKAIKLLRQGKTQESSDIIQKMTQDPNYKMFELLRNTGLGDSTMTMSELTLDSVLDNVLKMNEAAKNGNKLSPVVTALTGAFKSVDGGLSRFYELGDLIFKMGAFSRAIKSGKTSTEALRYAYEAYFDYSQLSRGASLLRDTGLVPFVSYTVNSFPALYKAFTQHPEYVALMGLILEGFHMAGAYSAYGGDSVEEVFKNAQAIDKSVPQYLQTRGMGGIMRTKFALPWASDTENRYSGAGRVTMFNATRMMPGGDVGEMKLGYEEEETQNLAVRFLKEILTSGPIGEPGIMAITDIDPRTGAKIGGDGSNLPDPYVMDRKRGDFFKRLWNTAWPNLPFIYGTYKADQTIDALIGEGLVPEGFLGTSFTGKDSLGIPKTMGSVIASYAGLNLYSVDPAATVVKNMNYRESQLNREKGLLNAYIKSPRTTMEAKKERAQEFEGLLRRQYNVMKKEANAVRRLIKARTKAQGGTALPQ